MNNAKDSKDEVKGWALDFENESQNTMKGQDNKIQKRINVTDNEQDQK